MNKIRSPSASIGKNLFEANCAACHQLDHKVIGPSLRGVVSKTSKEWFTNWVVNPKKFIQENQEAANLFKEYNELQHTTFSSLKEKDIDQLIEYLEAKK